jgi:hypothetical protein
LDDACGRGLAATCLDVNFLAKPSRRETGRSAGARGTWLAAVFGVFWLEVGDENVSMGEVVAQVQALTQLAGEIDARLAAGGVGGLSGACAIYAQLRGVLDAVSAADLERMTRQVADLQRHLEQVARRVAAIKDLKVLLDGLP